MSRLSHPMSVDDIVNWLRVERLPTQSCYDEEIDGDLIFDLTEAHIARLFPRIKHQIYFTRARKKLLELLNSHDTSSALKNLGINRIDNLAAVPASSCSTDPHIGDNTATDLGDHVSSAIDTPPKTLYSTLGKDGGVGGANACTDSLVYSSMTLNDEIDACYANVVVKRERIDDQTIDNQAMGNAPLQLEHIHGFDDDVSMLQEEPKKTRKKRNKSLTLNSKKPNKRVKVIIPDECSSNTLPWPENYCIPSLPEYVITDWLKNERRVASTPTDAGKTSNSTPQRRPHTTTNIVQILFNDLIKYAVYPTHNQYIAVVESLIREYPFLEDGSRTNYETYLTSLQCKFKNERRSRVNTNQVQLMKQRYAKRMSNAMSAKQLERNVYAVSLQNEMLAEERAASLHANIVDFSKQPIPDFKLINDLMVQSLSNRANDLRVLSIKNSVSKYPFLKNYNLLLTEMRLLHNKDMYKMAVNEFSAISAKIEDVYDKMTKNKYEKDIFHSIPFMIPELLNEKVHLLYAINKRPKQPQPTIVFHGEFPCTKQTDITVSIQCDGVTVVDLTRVPFDPLYAIASLISVYYVYNLAPTAGFADSFNFYETLIFKLHDKTSEQVYKLITDPQ